MLDDLRDFLLGGRVLDLAVGIVVGVAFGHVISSFVSNIVSPLFAAGGSTDFSDLVLEVGGAKLRYGTFLNDALAFLLVAVSVFFLVVRPVARVNQRRAAGLAPTTTCPHCLSRIPTEATRCAFCTAEQ